MFLVDWMLEIEKLAKEVPMIGTTISLSLAGIVVAMFWKAPRYLSHKFKNLFVYKLTIDNTGYGDAYQNYLNFLKWFNETPKHVFSKSLGVENHTFKAQGQLGPGGGSHFMFYKGSFYLIGIFDLPSEGSDKIKRQIQIQTFSFSKNKIINLFNEFSVKNPIDELKIYSINKDGGWQSVGHASTRKLNTVVINKEKKEFIVKLITEFLANKEWYKTRGIPYKLIILLYGPPGTGKTSIFKAMAAHFNKNSAIMDISNMSSTFFSRAVYQLPENTMLAVEDFDDNPNTHQRSEVSENNKSFDSKEESTGIGAILNTFDGIKELDGQIIFLSTNHIEKIDSAIIRPGRVDKCIYIPPLTHVEINEYIELMYPGKEIVVPENFVTSGSKLQELVIDNKIDAESFKEQLFKLPQENNI